MRNLPPSLLATFVVVLVACYNPTRSLAFHPTGRTKLPSSFVNQRRCSIPNGNQSTKKGTIRPCQKDRIIIFTNKGRNLPLFLSSSSFNNKDKNDNNQKEETNVPFGNTKDSKRSSMWLWNRRSLLIASAVATGTACNNGQPNTNNNIAYARDELFRPNPLTNPLLEQIRIWEQAEADELKYGGELAPGGKPGGDGRTDAYARLLVPILEMESDFQQLKKLLLVGGGNEEENLKINWKQALEIINQSKYEKVAFKKTFNAFSDNIYYNDPDRANLYLGGGATPKTEQSIAYLQRNELLTNIENLRAELTYLLSPNAAEEDDTEDLVTYTQNILASMDNYLSLVPPIEISMAKELMSQK